MQYVTPPQFLLCLFNKQNPVSLERRKFYRVVEPEPNDPADYVRIVDESNEDYLYPRDWFEAVKLTPRAIEALTTNAEAASPQAS